MSFQPEVQKLSVGHLITLYEIDMTAIGGLVERFHGHNDGPIVWQGQTYSPWAIEARDFERTGEGAQPLPSLSVGNIGVDEDGNPVPGVITALCLALNDLVGARLTRRRTLAQFLDGRPGADPTKAFPDEVWLVSQRQLETPEVVTFVLSSPLDFEGVQLPRRQVIANTCGWLSMASPEGGYRGAYCGYTGPNMFDINGNPVSDPAQDRCGGRVSDCTKRFGQWQPLSYGGYPSADRIR